MGLVDTALNVGLGLAKQQIQGAVGNGQGAALLDQAKQQIQGAVVNGPTGPAQEGIPSTVDYALNTIKKNEQNDQEKIERIEAFKIAFREILEPSDERSALAMFVKGQIKEYEEILLPAIANSLPMEPNARQYFIKELHGRMKGDQPENVKEQMNGGPQTDVPSPGNQPTAGGGGKAKAKSKKKRTKKPKRTKRRR